MAKKFVRGITDVKNINNQDYDTNNVNDILSDGEHTYIHRKKKDGTQEYHNLTDNIKTIEKVNNGLLEVTNYNKTKNSATLKVNHDSQKEQKLYSTDHTINIVRGDNGTGEFTNIDVNPAKIHEIVGITYHNYTADDLKGTMQTFKQPVNADYELFHLTVELNKNEQRANYNLYMNDEKTLEYLFSIYGINGQFNVNNGIFTFNKGLHSLEYYNNTAGVTYNNFITGFSFIVPKNPVIQQQAPSASTQVEKGDVETLEKGDTVAVEKTDEIVADKGVVTKGGKD